MLIMSSELSSNLLSGRICADSIFEKIKKNIITAKKSSNFINPGFAIVQIGDNAASNIYIANKKRIAKELGFEVFHHQFENGCDHLEIEKIIIKLNTDVRVHGIIMQLPVMEQYKYLLYKIDAKKDIDGLGKIQQANLGLEQDGLRPCTPLGIIKLLEYYNISFEQNFCVIGRSVLVGQSLALMLLHKHATVSVVHAKTKNLEKHTKQADVVISATGVPGLVKLDMLNDGVVVIDVGITKINGKVYGDFDSSDLEKLQAKNIKYTPVPGGVGPMTIACLMYNVVQAWRDSIFDYTN